MYNVFQPNHFYPNRTRSQDRIGGGVFNNAGRAVFGNDNMSQPDIHQNGRSSVNGYPGIEDLRRPSAERRTREPSRANSISSLVKMEDRVSKKYDPIFGMNGHPLLDEYAGVNKLEDQLGQVARGPVSGAGYGNNDEYHHVDVPSRNPSRNPSRQIGYPNDRYVYDTPNHFIPNQMPSTIAPYRGPMKKLHIPTSLPSIQKSQVVHSDNREFSPNYPNTYRQSNTYDDPNFHVYDFPRSKHHESVTYRELEDRLKQYNKDNKLRIKLLKQNQKIDMLMQNQMRSNSQVDIMSHAGNGGNVGYPYANRPYMMEPPNRMYADLVAQQQMWSKDLKKLKKIIQKSKEKERDDESKKSTGFSLSALLKNKLLKKKSTDPDQSLESVEVKKKDTSSKKPSTDKGKTKDKPKVSKDRKKTTIDKSKDPIAKVVLNTDGELVIDTAGPETEPEDPDEQEAQQLAQKFIES